MKKVFGLLCVSAITVLAQDSDVARGKYLVEEVGKCQDCHTPRTESGELYTSKWLKGAVLDFQPTHDVKGWHKTSPDLTSSGRLFARWGEAGLEKFLETGAERAVIPPILPCRRTSFGPMTPKRSSPISRA